MSRNKQDIRREIERINYARVLKEDVDTDEVINSLCEIEYDAAIKILGDTERAADKIRDPTRYIQSAVNNILSGVGKGGGKGKRGQDPTGKIARQVGFLNRERQLQEKIAFNEVVGPLSDIDVFQAMKVLKEVEDNASSIEHPTQYILDEVERLLKESGRTSSSRGLQWSSHFSEKDFDPTGKITAKIEELNDSGKLADPINREEVVEVLSAMDVSDALGILNDLESAASNVKNPTSYVSAAARRVVGTVSTRYSFADSGGSHDNSESDKREISRQISWLNENGQLKSRLDEIAVSRALDELGAERALQILKDVETRAYDIRDPTAFVLGAVRKSGKGGGKSIDFGGRKRAFERMTRGDEDRLRKHLDWLNGNARLIHRIEFSEIEDELCKLDVATAMKVLKDVELKAHELRDPTAYVLSNASRRARTGDGGRSDERDSRRHRSSDEQSEWMKAVSRQVGQLNNFGTLGDKVSYQDVKEPLRKCGFLGAIKILQDLVAANGKMQVTDPTRYVLTAAKNAVMDRSHEARRRNRSDSRSRSRSRSRSWSRSRSRRRYNSRSR